jgi:hypothetical protein
VLGGDSEIVDPASVAFITGHAGGDNMAAKDAHQEPLRVHLEFSLDVSSGIVLRDDQVALQPELEDRLLIMGLIRSNHQVTHDCALMAFFFSDGRIEPDVQSLVDLSLVFRSEDRECADFRRTAHVGSPARLGVEALDLDDADSAV